MRILVVEDDPYVRSSLVDLLVVLGHTAQTSESSEEAWGMLEGEKFDILLTDFDLPGKNGLELALEVHRDYPAMRVIIMTGGIINAAKARKEGFFVLEKPFGIKDLEMTLKAKKAIVVISNPMEELMVIKKLKREGCEIFIPFEDTPDILSAEILRQELIKTGKYHSVEIVIAGAK